MNLLFIGVIELVLLVVPLLAFFIYTIYHTVKNNSLTDNERLIWVLILLFANLLGMIAYWLFCKNGNGRVA